MLAVIMLDGTLRGRLLSCRGGQNLCATFQISDGTFELRVPRALSETPYPYVVKKKSVQEKAYLRESKVKRRQKKCDGDFCR